MVNDLMLSRGGARKVGERERDELGLFKSIDDPL